MALDPRIPLGTTVPQMRSPLTTLGALAQMEQREQLDEQREQQTEVTRRKLEDDEAVRFHVQRSDGNYDQAIEALMRGGRASAAASLHKQLYDQRTAEADQRKKDLDNRELTMKLATQTLHGVSDQNSLTAARAALKTFVPEELLKHVPVEYDKATLDPIIAWGTSQADQMKQQQDAMTNAREAVKLGRELIQDNDKRADARRKADEYFRTAASIAYSTANSQQDWDQFTRYLLNQGADQNTLAPFGNTFSPEAKQRARQLGLSPKESADVAGSAATRAETHRANLEDERRARDAASNPDGTPRRGSALTANAEKDVKQWKASQYAKLEAELLATYPNIRTTGLPADAKAMVAAKKLEIEDAARDQLGLPPLLETEYEVARNPAKHAELLKLRRIYKSLTDQETPLEQMQTLKKKIAEENNPATKAALTRDLTALRNQYRDQTGR
jgi:hypothetical protein